MLITIRKYIKILLYNYKREVLLILIRFIVLKKVLKIALRVIIKVIYKRKVIIRVIKIDLIKNI